MFTLIINPVVIELFYYRGFYWNYSNSESDVWHWLFPTLFLTSVPCGMGLSSPAYAVAAETPKFSFLLYYIIQSDFRYSAQLTHISSLNMYFHFEFKMNKKLKLEHFGNKNTADIFISINKFNHKERKKNLTLYFHSILIPLFTHIYSQQANNI